MGMTTGEVGVVGLVSVIVVVVVDIPFAFGFVTDLVRRSSMSRSCLYSGVFGMFWRVKRKLLGVIILTLVGRGCEWPGAFTKPSRPLLLDGNPQTSFVNSDQDSLK